MEVASDKFAHAGELTVKPSNEPELLETTNALRPSTMMENRIRVPEKKGNEQSDFGNSRMTFTECYDAGSPEKTHFARPARAKGDEERSVGMSGRCVYAGVEEGGENANCFVEEVDL